MTEEKENIIHRAVVNPDNTCCKCLKEDKNIHRIEIGSLGYGSGFDNCSTQINLCDDCLKETNPEWWELRTIVAFHECNHDFKKYEYEDEIFEFINKLPVEGREMVNNHYSYGACADYMESQDWIDFELGILSHEKCKEYCLYSPQEVQAYKDRFPNCKHVQIEIYSDGSSGSECICGARGDKNGNCGLNTYDRCYLCDMFEERDGEKIKTVDVLEEFYRRETERLNDMITYANKRLEMIKNKTLNEHDEY